LSSEIGTYNRDNTAGVSAIKANADRRATQVASTVDALRAEGITSARRIANALNERGIVTARSGQSSASTVIDALTRIQILEGVPA
jgi:hypothetical protein